MATFAWRGRNARGELVQGQLDAAGEGAVVDQLVAMGVAPVHIAVSVEPGESKGDNWLARLGRQSVSVEDILIFSRQMYTLNKAGVPILRAFAGLQASAVKPAMVDLLKDIRSSLDQGRELSVALGRHMDIFGAFYVAMIRVGEMTGRLTEVFLRLNEHMEFVRDVRERIKQALRYPTFVMIAMAIALVIINVFVIPVFAKVFAGLNAEPPMGRGRARDRARTAARGPVGHRTDARSGVADVGRRCHPRHGAGAGPHGACAGSRCRSVGAAGATQATSAGARGPVGVARQCRATGRPACRGQPGLSDGAGHPPGRSTLDAGRGRVDGGAGSACGGRRHGG